MEGKESRKRDQGLINKSATLNQMSGNRAKYNSNDKMEAKCGWCGRTGQLKKEQKSSLQEGM